MNEAKVGQAVNGGLEVIRNKVKENLIAASRSGNIKVEVDALTQIFAIVDSTITQCLPNVVSAVKRAK